MSQIHGSIYAKGSSPEETDKLMRLFSIYCADSSNELADENEREAEFLRICAEIAPDRGGEIGAEFLASEPGNWDEDLGCEWVERIDDMFQTYQHFSGRGDRTAMTLVKFLYALAPNALVQAYGTGDDDPWEFWIKRENSEIKCTDIEPQNDEEEDQAFLSGVYRWWHEGLPNNIKEGLLYKVVCNHSVVFTGVMKHGPREELESMAAEAGATIQGDVSSRTTLLVVGSKPGKSKLVKAAKFGTRIANEDEFFEMMEGAGYEPDDE